MLAGCLFFFNNLLFSIYPFEKSIFGNMTMKELLVMRHAKSDWNNARLSDHDRPLNNRGKADAPRMGQLLHRLDLTPELIISSTAERAMTTAELVALHSNYEQDIQWTRDFYHAEPETYIETLHDLDDKYGRVMVVGHNPGMAELVDLLTDESVHFTTANIAHISLPIDNWADCTEEMQGTLLNLWRPKEI